MREHNRDTSGTKSGVATGLWRRSPRDERCSSRPPLAVVRNSMTQGDVERLRIVGRLVEVLASVVVFGCSTQEFYG